MPPSLGKRTSHRFGVSSERCEPHKPELPIHVLPVPAHLYPAPILAFGLDRGRHSARDLPSCLPGNPDRDSEQEDREQQLVRQLETQ